MKILLTGEPGVGKSTLLHSVIDAFDQKQGFLTTEIRTDGVRTGFDMVAANGDSIELCSVDSPSEIRVSRYGVNLQDLNAFVARLPEVEPDKLIYIDEIGQMQLYSDLYKALVADYISRPNPFIGTLSKIYYDDFTDQMRKRDDVEVIEVTLENRNNLKHEIIIRIADLVQ